MKKLLIGILVLCCPFLGKSQVINDSGNHGLMLIQTKKSERMPQIEGSPYLDENFRSGTIVVEDKEPLQVFLRYNIHLEEIEIKMEPEAKEVYLLPKKKEIVYFNGRDTLFLDEIYFKEKITGYFIEHFEGNHLRLISKPVVKVSEPVKARNGYAKGIPAQFVVEKDYYLVKKKNNEVEKLDLNHRKLKKAYRSEEASKYLNKNKVKTEDDLVSFISFIDDRE